MMAGYGSVRASDLQKACDRSAPLRLHSCAYVVYPLVELTPPVGEPDPIPPYTP